MTALTATSIVDAVCACGSCLCAAVPREVLVKLYRILLETAANGPSDQPRLTRERRDLKIEASERQP